MYSGVTLPSLGNKYLNHHFSNWVSIREHHLKERMVKDSPSAVLYSSPGKILTPGRRVRHHQGKVLGNPFVRNLGWGRG
jgi:hypothetical protein